MGKINYKSLGKPLNMLLTVEISEKTALKEKHSLKVFEVNILPAKVSFWSGNQNIEIFRRAIKMNPLPDNDADAFIQQVSTVLNHLTLKLGFNGVPINLEKKHELWQKWLALRAGLCDTYTGDWVATALTEVDTKMLPVEGLPQYVLQDIFFNEYFKGVYTVPFIENNFYGKRTVFGLCPYPIRFNEKWVLETTTTGHLIKFSGKWDKNPDQAGFNRWLKTKTDDINTEIQSDGFYQLDKTTDWCDALESYYILNTGDYKKTLKIVLTAN